MQIAQFTFNPFQENTFVLYDTTKEAIIIDPGCSNLDEQDELVKFIEANELTPVKLINTHCHIDHVLGNNFIASRYKLPLTSHRGEQKNLDNQPMVSQMYGIPYTPSPSITEFLEEGDTLTFGHTILEILYAPGHSPAHICLFNKETKQLISGDVLFYESIGRTDLPGGDHQTLIDNITMKLMKLDDEVIVYPGHGPSTTIGHERVHNPFF